MKDKFHIIPAIDIIGGKCVRLTKGDYNTKKEYNENPVEVAQKFEDAGIERLHLVDLDGAKAKKITNCKVLEAITKHTNLHVDFGGGLNSTEDLEIAFDCGAKQVTGGSIAIRNEELFLEWLDRFGPENIILGADSKDGNIAISGWEEVTQVKLQDFVAKFNKKGLKYVISTDIEKDGAMQGPSFKQYETLKQTVPGMGIIASGGVSKIEDVEALSEMDLFGVIIGKAYYEHAISLEQLATFNR